MQFHRILTFLSALAFGTTAMAGHPPDVASAAHRFADAAEHLHRQLHRTPGHVHEAIDSHRLARAAEHFHRQVERGGSRRHLGHDFQELRDAYRHLAHQVHRTGVLRRHHHVSGDYREMNYAFHSLENAVSAVRHGYRGYRGGFGYGERTSLFQQFR